MTRAIDVHCHLSTRPQYEAWGPYLAPMERYYKFRPEVRSEEAMVAELRQAGVRACIIAWDAAAGSGGPPLTNDYLADLVRRFPGRHGAQAQVLPPDPAPRRRRRRLPRSHDHRLPPLVAVAGRDDRGGPPQGQRPHGDVGLVAEVLLGRPQARDPGPAPGPG